MLSQFKINGVYKSPKWSTPPGVYLVVLEHKKFLPSDILATDKLIGNNPDWNEIWLCKNAVTDEKVICTARFLRACDLVGEQKDFVKC